MQEHTGNEEKLKNITTEFERYFTSKSYINNGEINMESTQKLNDIVLFLAINTDFKKQSSFSDHTHLINIIPRLSKCVLANLCFDLNLIAQYCYIIERLPLELTEELLDQVNECLKRSKPKQNLQVAFSLLRAVVHKLSEMEFSNKTEETIDDIILITNVILQNLTGLFSDQVKTMKVTQIYQHMGFTLLNLLDFLHYVDENVIALKKLVEHVISITCTVVKSITIDVFCEWAEVEYEGQPLQSAIAGRAYYVLEKFQKNKLASELISLLGNIARKPKTIHEQIQEANIDTIIKKINIKDNNQRQWFKAMLNTRVFNEPKIVQCLAQWWNLCNEADVDRLLNVPLPNNVEHRQLIVKCANNISLEKLKHTLTIYFYRQKFMWKEDIQNELTTIFNQAQYSFSVDDLKTILLLILQNAHLFFTHFYTAVFKASLEQYKQVLELTKEIVKIDNIGLNVILKVLEDNTPCSQNIDKYIKFLEMLMDYQGYSWDFIVSNILLPLTDKYKLNPGSIEELGGCVVIFKYFSHLQCEFTKEWELVKYMLVCASENRCKSFIEFVTLKEEIARNCIEYIAQRQYIFKGQDLPELNVGLSDDPWLNYYKDVIFKNEIISFMNYLIPNFDLVSYTAGKPDENFTKLLKVLPRCVASEWRIIIDEIEEKCGFKTTINALTDILILLSDVTTQSKSREGTNLTTGLRFCLEMFGKYLLCPTRPKQQQILAINNLCRLLKYLPDQLKQTDGIVLVNLLPSEPFKDLAQNKEFLARIILINDKQVCKVLAEKMLNK